MADHVEEVLQLRLRKLETRVDHEADAVKEHFDEQRRFITAAFEQQAVWINQRFQLLENRLQDLRTELRAELRSEVGGLDRRIEAFQESTLAQFASMTEKMDAHHAATGAAFRDLLAQMQQLTARLPPA